VVMEILGHSGIAITMNTYAHVLPSLLGGAAEGMDDVLG
jgi:integrase